MRLLLTGIARRLHLVPLQSRLPSPYSRRKRTQSVRAAKQLLTKTRKWSTMTSKLLKTRMKDRLRKM